MTDFKSLMFEKGWLCSELAREMGVSRSMVAGIASGWATPSDRVAELAAKALGVTPDEIREAAPRKPKTRQPGERILRTRARRALMLRQITTQDVADESGMSYNHVRKILSDDISPTEAVTVAIEKLTDVGRRDLFPLFYGFDGDRGEI